MAGFAEEGGLRDEIGSSSIINSPRRRTSRSPSFAEAFGGKENQDTKGRATCAAATVASASPGEDPHRTPSAPRGSKRDARLFAGPMAHLGKLERGRRTESPFGPPKARLKALQRDDIHAGDLGRPAASNRTSGAPENPHRSLPSRTGRSAGDNAGSGWNGSCGGAGTGGGNGVLCGTFRAKRRVALRAARARGVPARTPKMLMVPSRLMDSTVASRAAAFTPPTPARPRFVPRQHFVGKHTASTPVPATAGVEGAKKRSAMNSKAVVRRGTLKSRAASGGGAVRERERRGLELVGEFDHEMAASRPSAKDTSFTPASPAGSFAAVLSIPERRSESAGGARTRLALGPPKRCDEKLSRKLEEQARCRFIGGSGGGYRKRMPSASEAQLEISLEALEGHDDVLMSPCASARSASSAGEEGLSTRKEASTWERRLEDAVTSSIESYWSMVSVDEIDREPNAREDRMSNGDPVARTLLTQSDEVTASGSDAILVPPRAFFGRREQPIVPEATPRANRTPVLGVKGNNTFFQFAATASAFGNGSAAGVGGVRGESMDRAATSTNPFSVGPRGGGAIRMTTIFRVAHGVGAGVGGVPAGSGFGDYFGGVCASTERINLATARFTAEVTRERRFRPIASPLP